MDKLIYVGTFAFSLVFSLLMVRMIMWVDHFFGIYAISSIRNIHQGKMPTMGGLAFYGVLFILAIVGDILDIIQFPTLYIISIVTIAVFIGMIDDIWGLSPLVKFLFLSVLVIIVIKLGIYARNYIYPAGYILEIGNIGYPVSFLLFFSIINSINFIDGMDGLAAGVVLIILVGLSVINYFQEVYWLLFFHLGIIGALIGFLRYNHHPAFIFMGDTGSLFLGTYLIFASYFTFSTDHSIQIFPLLVMLAVPLTDFFLSFLRRLWEGKNPAQADKEHLHHKLLQLGLSYRETIWFIYFLTFLSILLGIYVYRFHNSLSILFTTILFVVLIFVIIRIGYFGIYHHPTIIVPRRKHTMIVREPVPLKMEQIIHKILLVMVDLMGFNLALYVFIWFKSRMLLEITANFSPGVETFILLSMFWIFLFLILNQYSFTWDLSIFFKITSVIKSVFKGIIILGIVTFDISRGLSISQIQSLVLYGILSAFLVSLFRLALIYIEGRFKILQYKYKNTVVVGSNRDTRMLIQDFRSNPALLNRIVGYVSFRETGDVLPDVPKLGTIHDLKNIIHSHKIEEIIIGEMPRELKTLNELFLQCAGTGVVLKISPDNKAIHWTSNVAELSGHQLIRIFDYSHPIWQLLCKRLIDIGISGILLLVFSPVCMVFMLRKLIKKRGIITEHAYPGYRGEELIIKLFLWDQKNHSCIQGILSWYSMLRKVFRGKMSIVGPRPESWEWYLKNEKKIAYIYQRLVMKPGLTGMAQVFEKSYLSQKEDREKVRYDMFYIHNFSIWLDLRILSRWVIQYFSELFQRKG